MDQQRISTRRRNLMLGAAAAGAAALTHPLSVLAQGAEEIVIGEISTFTLVTPKGERIALETELLGLHNIENIVGASALLLERGLVAAADLQQRMGRANRARKVGELGWSETTDDGRSGLVSRFGAGVYKILHAGADTYALFFEWDDGRYDKLGCGTAEAMMDLANYKAKEEPPAPPPSHISLEMARFVCGTPEQKPSPRERLQSAIDDAAGKTPKVVRAPAESAVDHELRRSLHQENARYKARKERERRDEPAPDPIAPNAEMDQQLTDSLKRALADLDAQETKEQGGE